MFSITSATMETLASTCSNLNKLSIHVIYRSQKGVNLPSAHSIRVITIVLRVRWVWFFLPRRCLYKRRFSFLLPPSDVLLLYGLQFANDSDFHPCSNIFCARYFHPRSPIVSFTPNSTDDLYFIRTVPVFFPWGGYEQCAMKFPGSSWMSFSTHGRFLSW